MKNRSITHNNNCVFSLCSTCIQEFIHSAEPGSGKGNEVLSFTPPKIREESLDRSTQSLWSLLTWNIKLSERERERESKRQMDRDRKTDKDRETDGQRQKDRQRRRDRDREKRET